MIGVSGLFLWFPVFFGKFFPGWAFNIATVIHSDEALLAAGLYLHDPLFQHAHAARKVPHGSRSSLPGDLTLQELKHERPLEYERLVGREQAGGTSGSARRRTGSPMQAFIFGFAVVLIGFVLLILILLGQFYY